MKETGIKKEDIKTTNYLVNPNYKYEGNVNSISGYNGNATVEVKAKDPQLGIRLGKIVNGYIGLVRPKDLVAGDQILNPAAKQLLLL